MLQVLDSELAVVADRLALLRKELQVKEAGRTQTVLSQTIPNLLKKVNFKHKQIYFNIQFLEVY